MSDDEPWTLTEAAAWCRISKATFDRRIRPLLRAREMKTSAVKQAHVTFWKSDVQAAYRKVMGHSPTAAIAPKEKAPPAGAAPETYDQVRAQMRAEWSQRKASKRLLASASRRRRLI